MNVLLHFPLSFRWSSPLPRRVFLCGSAAAAFLFLILHFLCTLLPMECLEHEYAFYLILLWGLMFFLAVTCSPFVLLFFYAGLLGLNILAPLLPPLPELECSAAAAIPVTLLVFTLSILCLLHLIALALRRRRDAGKSALNFFAFSALSMALGFAMLMETSFSPPALHFLLCFLLPLLLQFGMLLRPSKPQSPTA